MNNVTKYYVGDSPELFYESLVIGVKSASKDLQMTEEDIIAEICKAIDKGDFTYVGLVLSGCLVDSMQQSHSNKFNG